MEIVAIWFWRGTNRARLESTLFCAALELDRDTREDDSANNQTATPRKNANGKNTNGDSRNINDENANDIFAASNRANAQAIATQLLFNDLLSSTIAVIDGNNVNNTYITLFGENAARFIALAQAQNGNENVNGDNSNRAANGDNFANNSSEFNNNSHATIGDSFNNAAINNSVFFTGKPHIAELGY